MNRTIAACLAAGIALFSILGRNGPKAIELSRRLIIEAIGIDAADDGVTLTLQTLDAFYGAGNTEGGDRKGSTKIYTFSGKTPAEAVAGIPGATGLVPLYSQVKLFVVSAETAKNGVAAPLDFFIRETRMRPDVTLCVSQRKAKDVVGADLGAAAGSAAILEEAVKTGAKAGETAYLPLFRFLSLAYGDENAAYCPIIDVEISPDGEPRPAFRGVALFKGDRMADRLPATGALPLLLLTGSFRQALYTADAGDARYAARLLKAKTRVSFETRGNSRTVKILIAIDMRIAGAETARDGETAREAVKTALSAQIERCFHTLGAAGFDVCRLRKRAALAAPFFGGPTAIRLESAAIELELRLR